MIQFQNWYEATLTSPITSTSLNIPLTPVPPIVTEGILVIDYDNPSLREIIHFTSKDGVSVNCPSTGDTGTLNTGRGYESTTARNHAQNAKVRMVLTAGVASAIQTAAAVIANQNNNGGWVARSETPVYASNNGQREFTFTVPGDLTGVIWQGMKVKMDRVVAPPTQAMSFTAASSQYATKTSPVGFSFTNTVTLESWVRLNSYSTTRQFVGGRADAANEWSLAITASGQVRGVYGSSSTFTEINSYQSLPLNRWMHIAFVVSSASAKTTLLYINGVSVPYSTISSAATVIGQSGNFNVGAYITPLQYFDGYIAEFRVWSVAQTQSQIQSNMFINLIGNESGLVFCGRGNGDWTDRTVNANNLTAVNGATFVTLSTLPSSYFNATEQFIVNGKPTYNAPNTTITVFGGTDFGLPSSGGLTNFYFSSQRAPYGFPASKGKWKVDTLFVGTSNSTPTSGTIYQPQNIAIAIPTGDFVVSYDVAVRGAAGSTTFMNDTVYLSTTTNSETDKDFTMHIGADQPTAGTMTFTGLLSRSKPLTLTALTTYFLLVSHAFAGAALGSNGFDGSGIHHVTAECAYI